ncbi:MAG: recombinase family protein, partial [Deltaproteobacteria bacterium]|nr:recombinase family protein [Deltaproteobacteria bacterium]
AANNSTPRVAIYARVSTSNQSTESQLLDLRRYVSERGWNIFREYCDNGISGTKDSRPALNELMDDARKRKFDVVLVHRTGQYENNRAEVSHQHTREQERPMRRFKSMAQTQRILSVYGPIQNLFRVGRHHLKAVHHRLLRDRAFACWIEVTCAC